MASEKITSNNISDGNRIPLNNMIYYMSYDKDNILEYGNVNISNDNDDDDVYKIKNIENNIFNGTYKILQNI